MLHRSLFLLVAASLLAGVFAGTHEAGLKFLEENRKKEGVVTLPSGLQYKVLKKGTGLFHPSVNSPCECHYAGTLIDGTEFDSSYARGTPTTFAPNQVIKGWTEAMQLMVEGDKWEMYIPSELAYGDSDKGPHIKAGDPLIFKMEIIKIKGDKVPASRCDVKTLEGCTEKESAFVTKFKEPEAAQKELKRLNGMDAKKMTSELANWLELRIRLLKDVVPKEEL